MNKKRIRQMDLALRRRLADRPAADCLTGHDELLRRIETEGYMQRFAPLFNGARLCCADVLALCREELDALCGGAPQEGWLSYAYDYARRLLYPEKTGAEPYAAGAVFLLSVLQVLFAAEGELLPHDPAWTFDFLTEQELADSACAPSYTKFLRQWKREYVYELMRLGLEVTPFRTPASTISPSPPPAPCTGAARRWTWRWCPAPPRDTISASSAAAPASGCRIFIITTQTCGSAAGG